MLLCLRKQQQNRLFFFPVHPLNPKMERKVGFWIEKLIDFVTSHWSPFSIVPFSLLILIMFGFGSSSGPLSPSCLSWIKNTLKLLLSRHCYFSLYGAQVLDTYSLVPAISQDSSFRLTRTCSRHLLHVPIFFNPNYSFHFVNVNL